MSSKAADRLAELLEAKERELADLQESVKEDRDHERWRWARHVELPKEQTLPVPRLELWMDETESDGYNRIWIYRMVYRHFLGHCVGVPLGSTKQGGPDSANLLDYVPFRDGAHINHDAGQFGWPMFIIKGDEAVPIPPREPRS